MKKIAKYIAPALLLCALSVSAAAAKSKGQTVTLKQDLVVGGSTVKSGTYRVTFDDQTNELTFSNPKTKEVVAKVAAQASDRRAGNRLQMNTSAKGDAQVLVAIAFEGGKQLFTVGGDANAARYEDGKKANNNQ